MIKKLLAAVFIVCTVFGLYTAFRFFKTENTLHSVFGESLEQDEDGRWCYRKPDGSRQELRSDWKLPETLEGLSFCIQGGYETEKTGFSVIFQNNEGAEVSLREDSLAVDQQIGGRWYQVPVLILGQDSPDFLMKIAPGEGRTLDVIYAYQPDISAGIRPLADGHYRLHGDFFLEEKVYGAEVYFDVKNPVVTKEELKEVLSEIPNIYGAGDVEFVTDIDLYERCYTAAVVNHSEQTVELYERPLTRLEYEIEGSWYQVNYLVTLPGMPDHGVELLPGESYEYTDNMWELCYSVSPRAELLPGRYRILFPMTADGEQVYLEYIFEVE